MTCVHTSIRAHFNSQSVLNGRGRLDIRNMRILTNSMLTNPTFSVSFQREQSFAISFHYSTVSIWARGRGSLNSCMVQRGFRRALPVKRWGCVLLLCTDVQPRGAASSPPPTWWTQSTSSLCPAECKKKQTRLTVFGNQISLLEDLWWRRWEKLNKEKKTPYRMADRTSTASWSWWSWCR